MIWYDTLWHTLWHTLCVGTNSCSEVLSAVALMTLVCICAHDLITCTYM